jgi:hypothetical protein
MSDPPRDTPFQRGARLFDAGAHFEAHEAWEARWLIATDEDERRLLQGLIQIAAGLHKLFVVGSVDSARRLLARGLAKLAACPKAAHEGFEVAPFRDAVDAWARGLGEEPSRERSTVPRLLRWRPAGAIT